MNADGEKTQKKAYLLPSDAEKFETVSQIVQQAANDEGFTMLRPDKYVTYDLAYYNHEPIISNADVIIAAMEILDLGLMAHLGYARGIGKPIVYISSDIKYVTAEYRSHLVLVYDLLQPRSFIEILRATLRKIGESPDGYIADFRKDVSLIRPKIFISYSHNDQSFLERLLVHLKPLDRDRTIDIWVDTRLRSGDKWKEEIERALMEANVAILLVSADFIASDFITNNELPILLKNAREKGTRIIPIVLKPCRFARHGSLKDFQSINDPQRPLIGMNEGERENCLDQVALECERLVK